MSSVDHVTLVLNAANGGGGDEATTTRKSLRRTWNQLPRCQRNLIIVGMMTLCLMALLFLPADLSVANDEQDVPNVALPFGSADKESLSAARHKLANDLSEPEQQKEPPKFPDISHSNKHENRLENVGDSPDIDDKADNLIAPPKQHQPLDVAKIQIEGVDLNQIANNNNDYKANDKNLEPLNKEQNDRLEIEMAVQKPMSIPGANTIEIEEFIERFNAASLTDGRKQHFHGATNERQTAVVGAFKHSWDAYKKYAWGHDNLKPISQTGHDWFGLGLTLIDSLDTMYIMGLEDEFAEARDWVANNLNFALDRDVNLFEVTIRVLGGLLSAYHLSGDKMFLQKSLELGNRLLPCFLSPSGIPYSDVNIGSLSAHSPKWSPDSSTSEVTTIQLEFRDLSRSTNIPIYERVINTVNDKVHHLEKNHGLVPIFINANTGTFRNYATISLGARGDSYYEYLLKQWIQTGRKDNDNLILDYMRSIDGVLTQLMRRTPREKHVYIGELINGKEFKPKMDHLTCYLPGTLLLGHKYGMPDSHLLLARDLLETCYQTYMQQPTHLAPEISYFALTDTEEHDIYVKTNDAHNLLRPEFVESLYYFYALTGNRTYQDMGWTIFEAFEKHTRVASGYTSIGNVKNVLNTRLRDMMESFWLGETLKYFYLLFSDNRNEVDLDKWVFNSEAHLFPVRRN